MVNSSCSVCAVQGLVSPALSSEAYNLFLTSAISNGMKVWDLRMARWVTTMLAFSAWLPPQGYLGHAGFMLKMSGVLTLVLSVCFMLSTSFQCQCILHNIATLCMHLVHHMVCLANTTRRSEARFPIHFLWHTSYTRNALHRLCS